MKRNRDYSVLQHITEYCTEIDNTAKRFNYEKEVFLSDSVYKNAIALCVLQIGELTANLTDEFKETYSQIPWRQIKAMRNIVAHNYGSIDSEILWNTVTDDIPELKKYCIKILSEII